MTAVPSPPWSLKGAYLENCNCAAACPCLFSGAPPMTAMPTEGACEVAFGFHVDHGTFGDVPLDGLNVGLIARTPGPMADGNWKAGLYLDERATEQQRAALTAIFSGQAGGVMGMLAPLIGDFLGAKTVPIAWRSEGKRRSLEIPDIAHVAVHAAPSIFGEDKERTAANVHPFAADGLVMAVGDQGSTWTDYGMRWDNSGRNAHYARIAWSNR